MINQKPQAAKLLKDLTDLFGNAKRQAREPKTFAQAANIGGKVLSTLKFQRLLYTAPVRSRRATARKAGKRK